MSVIYKYQFFSPELTIPMDGRVIACGWQNGVPTVWVQHDAMFTSKPLILRMVPTGVDFQVPGPHVGSAISDELVFHVYRVMV